MIEFRLPDIGEGIAEAEIVEWLVSEGASVKADQVILKIETDKAVADIPSPVSGTVLKINYAKGDTVNVGAVLCVIGSSEEKVSYKSKIVKEEVVERKVEKVVERKENNLGKIMASPAVRRAANEKGIDLSKISGSGIDGQILMSDLDKSGFTEVTKIVETPVSGVNKQRKYDMFGYVERVPVKGIRKVIAQNMIKSLSQSAQVTAMEDIDVSKLWDLRQKEKEHFAIEGVKLTFMPFVIKAVVKALQKHHKVNSSLEGDNIVLKKYYNIGIAVQTDEGLMVPVLKIAERKSISEIAKEIESLAEKCRSRTIDTMDLKGSTFTITNYGSVGGTYATPIINPGEVAILGTGRIFNRAVLDEKTGKVRNAKILPISLTFDHQVLDGAEATLFIEELKSLLEEPNSFMA
ncbi:2-oxo acid dehydrogenase subunit E2 [Candidatus Pacearchaeota archaeon]|nr:2-oxo acid dehydrogenase subunit E2 [Candidatus Pacearchaeota archaeon]